MSQSPPNKGGRPRKDIDLGMVAKLATIGCTHTEIAFALGVCEDTLVAFEGFSDAYKTGDAAGRQSLRHKQFQVALEGNVGMLVWLGKNRLGQKDTVTTEHTGSMTLNDGSRERLISKLTGRVPAEVEADPQPTTVN